MRGEARSAPRDCPVCGDRLALTRLGCDSCGTELSGRFAACDFCSLSMEDREVLGVFLASRGNMKDLERHLGGAALVTYCIWAFETPELTGTTLPFYELSIIPMGTALLRYTLILEQGHGAAPEEIFAHDRVLQALGLIWLAIFVIAIYLA